MTKGRSALVYFLAVGVVWLTGTLAGSENIRFGDSSWWQHQAVWLFRPANCALAVCGVFLAAGTAQMFMFRGKVFRVIVFILHYIPAVVLISFYMLEKRLPNYQDMNLLADGLYNAVVMAEAVILHYRWAVAAGAAAGIPAVLLGMLLGSRLARLPYIPVPPWLALGLYALAFFYLSLFRYPYDLDLMPVYSRVQLFGLIQNRLDHGLYHGLRGEIELEPPEKPAGPRHIIYIMDESVSGRRLSLNGYGQPTTPYLDSVRGSLLTFGPAMSAANASKTSNIIAVSGLRQDQLPDREMHALKQASIFQYASAAGRKCHYIDAQSGGAFINYLTKRDFIRSGTEFVQINPEGGPGYQQDRKALAAVRGVIGQSRTPTLIYVLKYGAHYQYDDKFPPGAYEGVFTDSDDAPAAYLRAIRWSADDFLA